LDAGWANAMLMMINHGKVFGRDFIFNYGPLGFLNVRVLPANFPAYGLLFIDLLTIGHFVYFLRKALGIVSPESPKGLALFWTLLGAGVLLWPWGFFADFSFTYFYFFLFWLLEARALRKSWPLFLAAALSVLIFYVKVNLSLIVVILFGISLLYFLIFEKFKVWILLLAFLVQILGIALGAWWMHVDLQPFIGYSLEMISTYPDAMSTMIISKRNFLVLLGLEGLMLLALLSYILKTKRISGTKFLCMLS
jgi:hypothetical protein